MNCLAEMFTNNSFYQILRAYRTEPGESVGSCILLALSQVSKTGWLLSVLCVSEQNGTQQHNKGPLTYRVFCTLKFVISYVDARYARS